MLLGAIAHTTTKIVAITSSVVDIVINGSNANASTFTVSATATARGIVSLNVSIKLLLAVFILTSTFYQNHNVVAKDQCIYPGRYLVKNCREYIPDN